MINNIMLKVSNISKKFNSFMAVNNLSFEIKKGEIVGLLGPNGAGKSTVMKMISSYFFPDSGRILVNGKDTSLKTLETQKIIGYLPESNPLYNDMLVFDYLAMTVELNEFKVKNLEKLVYQIAKSVNLENKLVKPIKELSKGYRQRVGLAQALINNPKLLILDEPTEGLDPNERENLHKLIKKLAKDRAILISTHVMGEVKAMCDRVIVINKGKLVASGKPESLTGKSYLKLKIEGEKIEENLKKIIKEKDGEKIVVKDKRNKIKSVFIMTKKEIRPELNKMILKNKWIIWEMNVQDEIEEIFKELV
jgi:ABC-2 type transport system ATP-binding protein